ncbi:MAG: Fic family protein [Kiritimatiellia bacterium]|nr:Fic family protein [Kiritimatiellia bacterium]
MKTYEKTHPWISFKINMMGAKPTLWMHLGEAASKCEYIAGVPLQPETAKRLHQLYLAKGAAATTAIEGNTLTEEEVLKRIEGKLELPPSKEYLGQEVDNIVNACNQIVKDLAEGHDALTSQRLKDFNLQVLHGLTLEKDVVPGEIRLHSVLVGNVYRGAPAEDCEFLLARMCEWLSGPDFQVPDNLKHAGLEMVYAILKAIVAHVYLAWIHPFGDGNGRSARLIEFALLVAAGVPQPACHLLSNHYNQTRSRYYQQLDLASKSGGDILPFIEYAVQGFVDGLREQLEAVRKQQWTVSWINYVHDIFRDKESTTHRRQRHLLLDLSREPGFVPAGKIGDLTPRLAKAYVARTSRTLLRDLKELEQAGFIERTAEGVRAKREIILAFLPWRKKAVQVKK